MPGKARTPKGATYWSGWTLPIGSVNDITNFLVGARTLSSYKPSLMRIEFTLSYLESCYLYSWKCSVRGIRTSDMAR